MLPVLLMPFLGSNLLGKQCATLSQCAKLFCDLADVQRKGVTAIHMFRLFCDGHGHTSLQSLFFCVPTTSWSVVGAASVNGQ